MYITADERVEDARGVDDGFWVICSADFTVSLCSRLASDFGIVAGSSCAAVIIDEDDRLDFEDIVGRVNAGEDVSALLSASSVTGYLVAHIKSIKLFSSYAAEIRLYRNKNEYLAATSGMVDRVGRVFDHVMRFAADVDELMEYAATAENIPDDLKDKLERVSNQAQRLSLDGSLIASQCAVDPKDDKSIHDVSALFDMISKSFDSKELRPFNAVFENNIDGSSLMCSTGIKRFCGIVLMLAAVTSRFSEDQISRVRISADGGTVTIDAACILRSGYHLYGRGCDFEMLYQYISAELVELITLENLTAVPEWKSEYSAEKNGEFHLRAVLESIADPDRLKFRDGLAGASAAISEYMEYLQIAFSPDPQEKGQNQ